MKCVMKFFAQPQNLLMKIGAVGFFSAVLFLFSACSVQQNQSLLSSKTSGADSAQRVIEAMPFAYDLAIDTISYNSCVGTALNSSGIHGFKMGANEGFTDVNGSGAVKGGLKLRSDFVKYLAQNMAPNFPSTTISAAQVQYVLQNSTANKNATALYAIRTASDLRVVPDTINPSDTPQLGRDGIFETAIFSEEPTVSAITKSIQFGPNGTVLAEGPRVYNLGGTTGTPDPIEVTFNYSSISDETFPIVSGADDSLGAGEEYADRLRKKFNSNTYVLTQAYGSYIIDENAGDDGASGMNTLRRPPNTTDVKKAYGRAYELNFTSKNSVISSQLRNILNRVTEKNLEDGKPADGVSWSCDNVLIMRSGELNGKSSTKASCSEVRAADMTNATVAAKVRMLRRHYNAQDWAIGFYFPVNAQAATITRTSQPLCLVNKTTECYLPTTGIITTNPAEDVGVQYDTTKECYLSRYQQIGVSYTGGLTGDAARRLGRCPQYASVCVRNSTSF